MLKREGPVVALGLYREIINLANRYGITHCYAAMEPALARLLNRLGFPFHEAGPLNSGVSPARQPYLIGAHAAKAGLAARNSCLYRFMFGGVETESQILTTSAVWPVAGESKAYRDVGLHI
jgi:N-acyl amino acid synthase of PEP-CTERM/exosortase system